MLPPKPSSASTDPKDVRKFGRLRCELLRCELGPVIDLSGSGMRLRTPSIRRLKGSERFRLTLACMQSEMPIECELVWKRKVGFRNYEIGVEFVDVTGEQRVFLTQLVQLAAVRRVMPPTNQAA